MNETELREFDKHIAEHVMRYRWWFNVMSTEAILERPDATWPVRHGFELQTEKPGLCTDKTDMELFRPTTDPAAALLVLEKILSRYTVVLRQRQTDKFYCIRMNNVHVEAATLSLTICLFARKVFA